LTNLGRLWKEAIVTCMAFRLDRQSKTAKRLGQARIENVTHGIESRNISNSVLTFDRLTVKDEII